jgi:hypothetical protein
MDSELARDEQFNFDMRTYLTAMPRNTTYVTPCPVKNNLNDKNVGSIKKFGKPS